MTTDTGRCLPGSATETSVRVLACYSLLQPHPALCPGSASETVRFDKGCQANQPYCHIKCGSSSAGTARQAELYGWSEKAAGVSRVFAPGTHLHEPPEVPLLHHGGLVHPEYRTVVALELNVRLWALRQALAQAISS